MRTLISSKLSYTTRLCCSASQGVLSSDLSFFICLNLLCWFGVFWGGEQKSTEAARKRKGQTCICGNRADQWLVWTGEWALAMTSLLSYLWMKKDIFVGLDPGYFSRRKVQTQAVDWSSWVFKTRSAFLTVSSVLDQMTVIGYILSDMWDLNNIIMFGF